MADNQPQISEFLRGLRKTHGLTQEALAAELGVSRQAVIALEQGSNIPSLPLVFRIAQFFQMSLDEICNFSARAAGEKGDNMSDEIVPFSPLREMRQALDRMMDDSLTMGSLVPARASLPAINVQQNDKEYMVEVHAPGYAEADFDIEVADDYVTITGHHEDKDEESGKQYLHREFASESFTRTLSLPENVNTDGATADMKNGILTITLPKVEPEKPRTKKIKVASR